MSIIEFGMTAPIYLYTLLGALELGIMLLTSVMLEGAVANAARSNITGASSEGETRAEMIQRIMSEDTLAIMRPERLIVRSRVFVDFDALATDATTTPEGMSVDPGSAGELVLFQVRYNWQSITPFFHMASGEGGILSLRANALVKNEPF